MPKKLKTKLTFVFDAEELEEEVPQLNFDIDFKTNTENKPINIVEIDIKKSKKLKQDVSTRLF